jgi:D-alanyl-D-alanine carboxypeptidase
MTAVLTIENLSLDQYLTIQQEEIDEVPQGMSVAQLQAGDRIRVRDLLYGLLLPSGSDVAVVFAHAVAGTTTNFVAMMNQKARFLGLNDTHYANPYGYSDPAHYTSAADLTALARYAMRFSIFAQIVAQPSYVLHATLHNHLYNTWDNTNGLLGTYMGANGVKTGSSDDAGYCMVFSATRNGHFLIGTEMHADSFDQLFSDAATLLDKGFAQLG